MPEEIVPRDAATVMLVRDCPAGGFEVFMLRRSLSSVFVGGAHVFPGGAVDEADRTPAVEEVCDGRTDVSASAVLGVRSGGLAFWLAAVRECFEEAGVLLAHRPGEPPISLADPEVADRFQAHRDLVNAGRLGLVELCRREGLVVSTSLIHYFSHWITPPGPPRRYDTRFFVAAAPPGQVPLHDDAETIASTWIRPAEALDRHRRGELEMITPTIRNLEAIATFPDSASLLRHAALVAEAPAERPRFVEDVQGGVRIALPGELGLGGA